jgi:hypothetical protein
MRILNISAILDAGLGLEEDDRERLGREDIMNCMLGFSDGFGDGVLVRKGWIWNWKEEFNEHRFMLGAHRVDGTKEMKWARDYGVDIYHAVFVVLSASYLSRIVTHSTSAGRYSFLF